MPAKGWVEENVSVAVATKPSAKGFVAHVLVGNSFGSITAMHFTEAGTTS
jgi:hypothetical protein